MQVDLKEKFLTFVVSLWVDILATYAAHALLVAECAQAVQCLI
jgi:hypothetical protein